jgi:hypothetical protein
MYAARDNDDQGAEMTALHASTRDSRILFDVVLRRACVGLGLSIVAAFVLISPAAHAAVVHPPQPVAAIVSPDAARPCLFFRLDGVWQADPTSANPTTWWFAIPIDAVGNVPGLKYQELTRMLYHARTAGGKIGVKTTGAVVPACSNFVEVDYVVFE